MSTHLVTGAGSGIGEAVADALHARGDTLVLLARNDERAQNLAARWPGTKTFAADLEDPAALAGAWPDDLHRLDSVVQCAGVVHLGTLAEQPLALWREQITVNLVAAAEVTRLALPALRAARGTLVLVDSTAGLTAKPSWSAYSASKFGLRGMADAVREEEAAHGVRVGTVFPSRTATPMQQRVHDAEREEYDASDFMSPQSVAQAILGALDLPADAVLTELTVRTQPG